MNRAMIAVVALGLAVGISTQVYLQLHPPFKPDAPLSVRFVPEDASSADALVCITDDTAPKNAPGLLCTSLEDFLRMRRDRAESTSKRTDL